MSGWCSLCDAAQALMCRLALVWCSAVTCRCSKSHTLHFRHFVRADQDAQAQAVALFDAGVGTSLDVTDTSVAVFAAETEALRTRSELDVARLSLRWATGEPLYTAPGR